jgi:hypothetical protein
MATFDDFKALELYHNSSVNRTTSNGEISAEIYCEISLSERQIIPISYTEKDYLSFGF